MIAKFDRAFPFAAHEAKALRGFDIDAFSPKDIGGIGSFHQSFSTRRSAVMLLMIQFSRFAERYNAA
jgi:hypothetical protein